MKKRLQLSLLTTAFSLMIFTSSDILAQTQSSTAIQQRSPSDRDRPGAAGPVRLHATAAADSCVGPGQRDIGVDALVNDQATADRYALFNARQSEAGAADPGEASAGPAEGSDHDAKDVQEAGHHDHDYGRHSCTHASALRQGLIL